MSPIFSATRKLLPRCKRLSCRNCAVTNPMTTCSGSGWRAAATGEEAYSIAMLLRELTEETHQQFKIQIYGTDLDDDAIAIARAGVYPPNIVQDVTPERLRRFFIKEESGYRVKKEIREMVVFAIQNVIKDPPFTKLDLLSCRNLMIYLEPEVAEPADPGVPLRA